MKLLIDPTTDTVKIGARRVYKCKNEGYVLPRKKVWKDKEGAYFCNSCNHPVEDITNTVTGTKHFGDYKPMNDVDEIIQRLIEAKKQRLRDRQDEARAYTKVTGEIVRECNSLQKEIEELEVIKKEKNERRTY